MVSLLTAGLIVISSPLVALVALWVWYNYTHRQLLAVARTLPTALPTLPILGHLHYLLFGKTASADRVLQLISIHASGTSCIWLGPVPLIVLSKSEDVQKLLNNSKALGKSLEYSGARAFFGDALPTAPVHTWKTTRRYMNAVYHHRNVDRLVPVFNETSLQLVEDLSDVAAQGSIDVKPYIFFSNLKKIFCLLFGKNLIVQEKALFTKELGKIFQRLQISMIDRVRYVWLWWDVPFKLLYGNILTELDDLWNKFTGQFLFKALHVREGNGTMKQINDDNFNERFFEEDHNELVTISDVFHKLREIDERFGFDYLGQETTFLLITGLFTPSSFVTVCLAALGSHPDVQQTLYEEIMEVVGSRPNRQHVTVDDINKMAYLDKVMKETFRRFTLVPVVGRRSEEDIQFSDCNIPAGTSILVSIAGLHMDPKSYPDPNKFDPGRFSPENIEERNRYSYLPFSAGPRNCLGSYYSLVSLKIMLVHLLREYSVHSDVNTDDLEMTYAVTLAVKEGFKLLLKKRN